MSGSAVLLVFLLGALGPIDASRAEEATGPEHSAVAITRRGAHRVEGTDEELARAGQRAEVDAVVERGRAVMTALSTSAPLVGAPVAWDAGHRGAGKVVVVIDTGVSGGFGGTLVGQACIAANADGTIGYCGPSGGALEAFDGLCFDLGVCGGSDLLDAQAGRPCGTDPVSKSCAHGSAVAAVVARHETPTGVAPDAGVYAIRVFDPAGASADLVDILLALDHAADLVEHGGLDVASVNLSISTSATFAGSCDSAAGFVAEGAAFRSAFERLRRLGIPSVVASGNDGQAGRLGFPACVSNAISVGATTTSDRIASFGNRGPALEILAPGTRTDATSLSIPSGTDFEAWRGTSFSSPHVAGAFALLAEEYPRADPAQLLWIARAGSIPIVDPASGRTYRRLRLRRAVDVLNARAFVPLGRVAGGGDQGVAADFDGDGTLDVLTYTPGGAPDGVTYGGPSWQPARKPISIDYTYVTVAGQFTGAATGPADLLLYGPGSAIDKLWPGNANRTFSSTTISLPTWGQPVVGDFDGDGWDDLLVNALSGPDNVWYGGLTGFSAPVSLPLSNGARTVALDVDGDGQDEMVHHRPGTAPDRLWRFTSRSTFTSTVITMGSASSWTARPVAANLDGVGGDDLVLVRSDGTGVRLLAIAAGFGPPASTPTGAKGTPTVGDVDENGTDDIAWVGAGSIPDVLWYGLPSGAISAAPMSITGSYVPILADLDDSHGADLVLVAPGTTMSVWWAWR